MRGGAQPEDDALTEGAPTGGDVFRGAEDRYGKLFWARKQEQFEEPWYRLEKSARLIRSLAAGRTCSLLDVGCGPATLMQMLPANIRYRGIDLVVPDPAPPHLIPADLRHSPVCFGDEHFDFVIAQGIFEYLADVQRAKFAEIASVLTDNGLFIVTYTNFNHHRAQIYEAFSNVQPIDEFRADLSRYFIIRRAIPGSHNWRHGQPNQPWLKALNLRVTREIPWMSRRLAVEYYFVCSPRSAGSGITGRRSSLRPALLPDGL
jgi:SAM-dependent methyltransferase